ncbi:splicing regulator ARVCF-like [Hypanus sabinus]|uniref:splicing regulator ARVCF-like n=1 Tax=Hypanus sabinus TaxID=79690 RepID=UPI0028C4A99D|nr:splicing regulator ARVCF-like [Hypanus sabinus]
MTVTSVRSVLSQQAPLPPTTMEGPAVESAADILACVREQEVQFERLTQALEKERRDSSFHSPHSPEPSWNRQISNGPVYGSGQGDRWLIADSPPQNGPKDLPFPYSPRVKMLQDPGPYIEETVTVEEDPDPPASIVSLEMDEDGNTRRTETRVSRPGGAEPGGGSQWPETPVRWPSEGVPREIPEDVDVEGRSRGQRLHSLGRRGQNLRRTS